MGNAETYDRREENLIKFIYTIRKSFYQNNQNNYLNAFLYAKIINIRVYLKI